jgi:hypothetical protein
MSLTLSQQTEILALREKKLTPKQIARKLGCKVSDVSQFLQNTATAIVSEQQERGELAPIADCFVNQSCRDNLLNSKDFKDNSPKSLNDSRGLALVWVGRKTGYERYLVCTYLIDYWCLGLKDTIGIRKFNGSQYQEFLNKCYLAFNEGYCSITLPEAQAIVYGSIDYAESMGLKPHRDFEQTKEHLGQLDSPIELSFGRDGKPCYIQGPYDDTPGILKALKLHVGEGNFNYLMELSDF